MIRSTPSFCSFFVDKIFGISLGNILRKKGWVSILLLIEVISQYGGKITNQEKIDPRSQRLQQRLQQPVRRPVWRCGGLVLEK